MKAGMSEKWFRLINALLLLSLCAVTLYPYINQLAISLNDGQDTVFGGVTVYPRAFTWANYSTVFSNASFAGSVVVSVLRVLLGTLLGLVLITGAAYALTKKSLPGRSFFILYLLMPTFISGGLIPVYFLYRYLGLMNHFLVYILPMVFVFFYMIIIRTYIQSLPDSLEEAALLDGANEVQILGRIIIPLSMPVMATVTLWLAVHHWNDWTTSLYFVTDRKLYTLQFIMYKVIKEAELVNEIAVSQAMTGSTGTSGLVAVTPESIKAATFIVATLPIVLLYPFLQKYFINGVMIGAIKE